MAIEKLKWPPAVCQKLLPEVYQVHVFVRVCFLLFESELLFILIIYLFFNKISFFSSEVFFVFLFLLMSQILFYVHLGIFCY